MLITKVVSGPEGCEGDIMSNSCCHANSVMTRRQALVKL